MRPLLPLPLSIGTRHYGIVRLGGNAWPDFAMPAPIEGAASSGGAVGSSAGSTVAGATAGQFSTLTNLPVSWNMITCQEDQADQDH